MSQSPPSSPPEPMRPAVVSGLGSTPDDTPKSVPVQLPLHVSIISSLAFALSALLSPYLVIPAGTIGIVATATSTHHDFLTWTALSVFFSTVVPAVFVIVQILRGKITDVHVMEREQRGGPFVAALISSLIGAIVLHSMGAPKVVWGIGIVFFCNGLLMLWISKYWKISIHVAVLSATLVMALHMIPAVEPWRLLWMIPALIWARVMRQRHTALQGLAGCAVACAMTAFVLFMIHIAPATPPAR